MAINWDKSQQSGDLAPAAIQDRVPPARLPGHQDMPWRQDQPWQQGAPWQQHAPWQHDLPWQQDLPRQGAAALPEDRPLGRRVAAALIDLGLLSGLYIILSLAVGPTSAAFGPFRFWLTLFSVTVNGRLVEGVGLYGAWAVLYVVLLPVYYFALEAAAGQTVGKCLLGLRVLRADGGRASAGPIAGRTLLRLIDGLPVLYLAGFIALLATGGRRQRLGDLAAGTIVARAQPARHRGLAWASVILVVLAAAGLSAYRAASPGPLAPTYQGYQAYRGHGISFRYPAGWREESRTVRARHGAAHWAVLVSPGTEADGILVANLRLSIHVSAANRAAVTADLRRLIEKSFRPRGVLRGGAQQITIGGLPGFRFRASGTLPDGTSFASTLNFAFNGTTGYLVNCQHAHAGAAVAAACSEVIRTFWARQPPPAAASSTAPAARSAPPAPLTRTRRWLNGLTSLQEHLSTAMPPAGVPATPESLRVAATALRRCSPQLAGLGPPPRPLRPAYRLARQACASFRPAARCFATAARVMAAHGGNASRLPALFACIQASSNGGTTLIASAVAAGSGIQTGN
jgi:uncharacterized RDD family membrane protein YckC